MGKKDSKALPKSFNNLIRTSDKPVLVDFWAEWCGPCRIVSPIIEQLAKEYSERLLTVKVNIDKKRDVATHYKVLSIPTIMLFWKGEALMRIIGAQSYEQIKEQIELNLAKI